MECRKCGTINPDDCQFCGTCGTYLRANRAGQETSVSQPQAAVAAHQPPTPQQQPTRLLAWITPLGLLSSLVWGAIGASQILGRVASRRGIVGLGILPDSALAQDYIIGIGAANLLAAIGQTIPLVATALRKWRAVEPLRRIFRNGFLWVGGYGLASAIIYEDITFLAIAIPLAALEGALWLLVDRLVYIADRLQQDTGQHQQRDTPEVHVGIVEPEFVTYAASPGSPASSLIQVLCCCAV